MVHPGDFIYDHVSFTLYFAFAFNLFFTAIIIFGINVPEILLRKSMAGYSAVVTLLCLSLSAIGFSNQTGPIFGEFKPWFQILAYQFEASFLIDHVTATYTLMIAFVFPTIVRFSFSYLHRDPGIMRYYYLLSLMSLGLLLVVLSGNLDVLIIGWEIVGFCSVFLISYFNTNRRAVENSYRALCSYRICDMSLLLSTVYIHHTLHTGTFLELADVSVSEGLLLLVSLFVLGATLAKSALLPFSNWLFRAVEGPTTSSAIFYGALSIHLGPFLLLRTFDLWSHSIPFLVILFAIGFATAVFSFFVGQTRTDAKTQLTFVTMTHIGIIYMELSLGFVQLALWHSFANAGLRTWQFLRSLSLIQDFQDYPELASGLQPTNPLTRWIPKTISQHLYLHAFNLFYLDAIQRKLFSRPILTLISAIRNKEPRAVEDRL